MDEVYTQNEMRQVLAFHKTANRWYIYNLASQTYTCTSFGVGMGGDKDWKYVAMCTAVLLH